MAFATLGIEGIGHPPLSWKEVAYLSWRLLEFGVEEDSCFTLVVKRFESVRWNLEEPLLLVWSLGYTSFLLNMDFLRFLQVLFHVLPWL